MKTEGSVTFSDTPKPNPEKEIYTEDSNSIKIHKFDDVRGDNELTLGKHLNYRFKDLNSALPKVYNIDNDLSKKKCENMESFGVIRSLSQNSQDL